MDTIVVYSSYTEAQKRASEKWNRANWERVKELERLRYKHRVDEMLPFYELAGMMKAIVHPEYKPRRPYRRRIVPE